MILSSIERTSNSFGKEDRVKPSHFTFPLLVLICTAANGQYMNEPYVVANKGGPLWWSDAAYNAARNEYCMTWQNGYVIKWRRLDSTGAVLGSELSLVDGVTSGHHYSVVCYN